MFKLTNKETNNKIINWTLPQKIDHSLLIIESFISKYPNCTVSFSGGIDSLVLLHLVRFIDKDRKAVFVNTTNEHTSIIKFVKTFSNIQIVVPKISFLKIVEKYGFPLISKQNAYFISQLQNPTSRNAKTRNAIITGKTFTGRPFSYVFPNKYKYLVDAPFNITDKCCYYLKKKPLESFNKEGSMIGSKVQDSRNRRMAYLKTGCINEKKNTAYPLSIWTTTDIWKYIRQNKIVYCDLYDDGEKNTGCAFCGFGIMYDKTRFERLKRREPKRYQQMMKLTNKGITYKEALETVMRGTLTKLPSLF